MIAVVLAAFALGGCPHDAALGELTYDRGSTTARATAAVPLATRRRLARFDTRWQLWKVGLLGSRTLLDTPPSGSADESPLWSPDGSAIVFVRERRGHGRAVLLRNGTLFDVTSLGYSLGFYGHHDWGLAWRP